MCYNCVYASKERIADITIGDYWGIEKEHHDFDSKYGVSAVLINSKKGLKLFEDIKENLEYIESSFEKVKNRNQNLVRPTEKPKERNMVYKDIDKKNFKKYCKENLRYKRTILNIIKGKIPTKIKEQIKVLIK